MNSSAMPVAFKRGSLIEVEIQEVISEESFIVNFQGRLLRMQNDSNQKLEKGHILNLRVVSENPLRLRFEHRTENKVDRFA